MKKIFLILLLVFFGGTASGAGAKDAPPRTSARLQKILKVWVYEKGGDVVNDVGAIFDQKAKKITLKCGLRNLGPKEIHAVRGTLRFSTYFGDTIADLTVQTVAVIPPGRTLSVTWNVGPDRLRQDAFDTLQKAKLDQLKVTWYPSIIVFTDGTSLK